MHLCEHLTQQRRNDLAPLYKRITTLVRSRAAALARQAALDSPDRQVRRTAFVVSAESEGVDLRALMLRALHSDDLWVRIWAIRLARTRLYGPALRELLGQAHGDRSVPVRREALLGFIDEYPELLGSLMDPCTSLREMARFYLRKKANLDFAVIYQKEVTRLAEAGGKPGLGAQLATAIAGLGETGKAADADTVELFTIDERPRVRKAALQALARLDGEAQLSTLAAALSDPHPGVFRTALQALGARLPLLGEAALWRAWEEGGKVDPQRRRQLAVALSSLPRWTSVRCLLVASADKDATVKALVVQLLTSWAAAVNYTRPTSEERAVVLALIDRAPIDHFLRQKLTQVLAAWSATN